MNLTVCPVSKHYPKWLYPWIESWKITNQHTRCVWRELTSRALATWTWVKYYHREYKSDSLHIIGKMPKSIFLLFMKMTCKSWQEKWNTTYRTRATSTGSRSPDKPATSAAPVSTSSVETAIPWGCFSVSSLELRPDDARGKLIAGAKGQKENSWGPSLL